MVCAQSDVTDYRLLTPGLAMINLCCGYRLNNNVGVLLLSDYSP